MAAHQAPLSLGFSSQEYRSGLPFPSPMHAKLLQSWPTLCNLMDSSPPDSSAHWILQSRILEWVAISFSLLLFPPDKQLLQKPGCLSQKPEHYLHQLLPSHLHSQSISKFCQFCLQNLSQMSPPLLFPIASNLGQVAILAGAQSPLCLFALFCPTIHSPSTVTRMVFSFKRQIWLYQRSSTWTPLPITAPLGS